MTTNHESQYVKERDEASDEYADDPALNDFKNGANWGRDYERKRTERLVDALKRVRGISGAPTHGPFSMGNIYTISNEAIREYEEAR